MLAAFVGHVPTEKLAPLLELFDGEALLRAGFVLAAIERLDPSGQAALAAVLREDARLRATATGLIARAPGHLRALLDY